MARQTDIGYVCQAPIISDGMKSLRIFKAATEKIEQQFSFNDGDRITLTIDNSGLALWDPDTSKIVWDSRHHGLIGSAKDWNELYEGTWYFNPDSLKGANAPSAIGYKYGMVLVVKDVGDMWTQIAYPHNPNQNTAADRNANVMLRQRYGSTWSAWRVI